VSIYDDHCKTADDVRANARRVQMLRQSMLLRPAPPTPPAKPPPLPAAPRLRPVTPETIETPHPLPVLPGVRHIPIRAVVAATCFYFDLPETAIFTGQRLQGAVFMRHVCMYVATKMTRLSLPDIAHRLIKGDHTTVFHARAKIAAQLKAGHVETVAVVDAIIGALRRAFPDAQEPVARTHYGRGYSPEDVAYIKRRWTQDGALVREIAQELGRSTGGVWTKMKKSGLAKESKASFAQICRNPECGREFPRTNGHQQYCCAKCCRRGRNIRERKS
jgi:hypothetical protein